VAKRRGWLDPFDDRLRFRGRGIFRLVRGALNTDLRTKPAADIGAWAAAFAFGANPNLIYMQRRHDESLYLALFIWAVVYFSEFIRSQRSSPKGRTSLARASARVRREEGSKSRRDDRILTGTALLRCAGCLAAAELTRYDGWFLAGALGAAVVIIALRRWQDRALRAAAVKFLLAIAVAPVLWLAYNAAVYGDALAFANSPYSAQGIEQRVHAPIQRSTMSVWRRSIS